MLKSYFTIAYRNLRKQKAYAFINVAGLALGLACSFFVYLWVEDELNHNRFLFEGERVHQVLRNIETSNGIETWGNSPKPLARTLKATYPEITETAITRFERQVVVNYGDQSYREKSNYANAAFFEVFKFPFIQGNAATALQDESSVVITDRTARKIFGEDWQRTADVIGKPLRIDQTRDFIIRGVIEDLPNQSTIQFDVLLSIEDFFARNTWVDNWGTSGFITYVQLEKGANARQVSKKIEGTISRYWNLEQVSLMLQPFEEVYLYSDYEQGMVAGGRIEYVRIFSLAGIFLLLIACINFVNLATARSLRRAREIGVRKTIGANRTSLFAQFLGESVLISIFSAVLALASVLLLLPYFNMLTGKQIGIANLDIPFFGAAVLISAITGLLAGGYPALYLSGFNPLRALRYPFKQKSHTINLRKGLIVAQFTLSALLIIGTLVVYLQVRFISTMDLGLDRENVLYVAQEGALLEKYNTIRDELLRRPGIAEVTASYSNPLSIGTSTTDPQWPGKDPDDDSDFYILDANFHFIELMDMEIIEGRSFSEEHGTDSSGFVVNEETAALIGEDVLGKELSFWGNTGRIIGVVKNFEMNSMYSPIEPVIIRFNTDTNLLYVKSNLGQTTIALESLSEVAKTFNPAYPLEYSFLDQMYERTYRSETVLGRLSFVFTFIAIFVSCLGLLGLISFTTQQRTKEIGVRKVLGASALNLVGLLTKEVLWLVLIGVGLAIPVAYVLASRWLAEFEQHVELSLLVFLVAGLIALSVAWTTISVQSIKTALTNPIRALRYE